MIRAPRMGRKGDQIAIGKEVDPLAVLPPSWAVAIETVGGQRSCHLIFEMVDLELREAIFSWHSES